ncbi:hypothetical protein EDB19DRAFT_1692599 [Suillus lakei]|nr:hypothetical protein EDB19DRAFT_1692599 [Suillus lakei]
MYQPFEYVRTHGNVLVMHIILVYIPSKSLILPPFYPLIHHCKYMELPLGGTCVIFIYTIAYRQSLESAVHYPTPITSLERKNYTQCCIWGRTTSVPASLDTFFCEILPLYSGANVFS